MPQLAAPIEEPPYSADCHGRCNWYRPIFRFCTSIESAGPSIILGYLIGGLIAFLIMRQLGEMIVQEPVTGSFSYLPLNIWGNFAGFLTGWNYWILYILVVMTEADGHW